MADLFPLCLERFEFCRGFRPIGGIFQGLGSLHQSGLLFQIGHLAAFQLFVVGVLGLIEFSVYFLEAFPDFTVAVFRDDPDRFELLLERFYFGHFLLPSVVRGSSLRGQVFDLLANSQFGFQVGFQDFFLLAQELVATLVNGAGSRAEAFPNGFPLVGSHGTGLFFPQTVEHLQFLKGFFDRRFVDQLFRAAMILFFSARLRSNSMSRNSRLSFK